MLPLSKWAEATIYRTQSTLVLGAINVNNWGALMTLVLVSYRSRIPYYLVQLLFHQEHN